MLSKIGRLFQIKTRFEAWAVIYALALGAVARGQAYLSEYPGFSGWLLAAACTGVVFLAGAKLLDSVKPSEAVTSGYRPEAAARIAFTRNPPTTRRPGRDSESRLSRRTGSLPTTRPSARRAGSPEGRRRNRDW